MNMRSILLLLLLLALCSCDHMRKRKCGVVVDKFQTGRFSENYHLAVRADDGERCVVDVHMELWAHHQRGDRFCGCISNTFEE